MKNSNTRLALAALGAAAISFSTSFAQSESRKPIVITPPAVKDGSNASRAPFPAARPADDIKAPDGQPIDANVPPNTTATNTEPNVLPEPRVAIFQSGRPPGGITADPGVLPTGRTNMSVATSLDSVTVVPSIRAGAYDGRDHVFTDVEARMKASDTAVSSIRSTSRNMSDSGRTQFNAADAQVKESEKALKKSLKAARKANASEWDAARAQLAADYEAYASALASVDAAAGVR